MPANHLASLIIASPPFGSATPPPPLVIPCTGARRRRLPTGHRSRPSDRRTSPMQVLVALGSLGRWRSVGAGLGPNYSPWPAPGRAGGGRGPSPGFAPPPGPPGHIFL